MNIKSINIRRLEGYELRHKTGDNIPLKAQICLVGGKDYPADINIEIPQDVLEPIVAIIAQATAAAMEGATRQFHEDVQAMLAGPAIEHVALPETVDV